LLAQHLVPCGISLAGVDYRDFGKGARGQSDLDWFPGQVIDILKKALSEDGKRQVECEVKGTF
jgi:hypothetical protein